MKYNELRWNDIIIAFKNENVSEMIVFHRYEWGCIFIRLHGWKELHFLEKNWFIEVKHLNCVKIVEYTRNIYAVRT
jgi:hypothetical protein